MAYSKIKYELQGAVALISMSDPDTLNAISIDMTAELTDAFGRAVSEARCIVLTGEGRAFSSGANLASGPLLILSSPPQRKEIRILSRYLIE
jgi:2-(1,2-epoxy-1,2-dihydrophenyl)acetyl-CoA isomerase